MDQELDDYFETIKGHEPPKKPEKKEEKPVKKEEPKQGFLDRFRKNEGKYERGF